MMRPSIIAQFGARIRLMPARWRIHLLVTWMFSAAMIWCVAGAAQAAEIEFVDGKKLTCRTLGKTATHLQVEVTVGSRKIKRDIPLKSIHKVVINGKSYVLNKKTSGGSAAESGRDEPVRRSSSEVRRLIQQQGRTPPDWFASTPLNYPKTLDTKWPQPAPKGWNNQKNVGQYIWDIVNPNENRWKSGTRLVHHLLTLHPEDKPRQIRIMKALGGMYFRFFQDYARAAYWWQQAGVQKGDPDSLALAECYYRLGNKQMALDLINSRTLRTGMIKLLGDMGETSKAVKLANDYVRLGGEPHRAYLFAGDALRSAGQFSQAIQYYQKVLDAGTSGNRQKQQQRLQQRARASLQAIRLFELSDVSRVADGTYTDSSIGYEGPVHVAVTVKSGRIEDVQVTQHKEKQFYSALKDVPRQIIKKQGVKGVDATSRATITGEAIINAAAKALAGAASK